MKARKLLALGLTAIIGATMMAGCGGGGGSTTSQSSERYIRICGERCTKSLYAESI